MEEIVSRLPQLLLIYAFDLIHFKQHSVDHVQKTHIEKKLPYASYLPEIVRQPTALMFQLA